MFVERQVELRFHPSSRDARTHTNLSAVRADDLGLWLAGDETATIEHLTFRGDRFDDQRTFALADFVDLPAGPMDEADIEGLARTDGWLWAIGSHSLKRKKAKRQHSADKSRRRLGTVVREENRYILVRLPLSGSTPVRAAGDRTAAILAGPGRNLADLLVDDPHLAPFLAIPSKDNGLDIEGIAVLGDRVFVGLRGPVLRGCAVLLEIRPETDPRCPGRLRLAPIDGAPYRTHFVSFSAVNGPSLQLLAVDGFDGSGRVRQRDSLPGMAKPCRVAMPIADHRAVPRHAGCVQSRHRVTNSNNKTTGREVIPLGRERRSSWLDGVESRLTGEEGVLADVVKLI
ncbi:DUF3616 domain-containing protein [Streptosporangium sp. NPDC000396]|uniref:DUF3616 domain-containing protein n=1 Tax=Streptosporangium sp. NPDC000396 TaxID=3366185 RepID=UPI0036775D12